MSQFFTRIQYEGAAAIIRNRSHYQPTIGFILGSGLGGFADTVENADLIPYHQIPHWPVSTVSGHSGQLVLGKLEGHTVIALQGRTHFYEGYSIQQVTLPVRVMHLLGVNTLIVTNAAGGLNPRFNAGEMMLINDHLNFLGMMGHNPLRGPNDDLVGARFPDLIDAYSPKLRQLAHQVAQEAGFVMQEGVYAFIAGPNYETPAEVRFLQAIGADAVGMSTVPEVVVARHAGMDVLGISTISNMAISNPLPESQVNHSDVLTVGKQVVPRLISLLRGVLQRL